MARIDLNETNGWIPEPAGSDVLTVVAANSAVEAVARKENMDSNTKSVPRFLDDSVAIVAEGATIPEASPTLDEVILTTRKFAKLYRISEEDYGDALVNVLNAFKAGWANSYARFLDNATLGVTNATVNGTTVPFKSVYAQVPAGNKIVTAGALKFEHVSNALAALETGNYFNDSDIVVVANPAFAGALRNLKDASGARVVAEPLNGTPGSIFGYELRYSAGAKTSATATDAPAGNPLLVVANRQHLILGVRSGPESMVSTDALFTTDERYLKVRARRAFAVGRPEATAVVELTAS
jgi:HK97 family phage major capsid protein